MARKSCIYVLLHLCFVVHRIAKDVMCNCQQQLNNCQQQLWRWISCPGQRDFRLIGIREGWIAARMGIVLWCADVFADVAGVVPVPVPLVGLRRIQRAWVYVSSAHVRGMWVVELGILRTTLDLVEDISSCKLITLL